MRKLLLLGLLGCWSSSSGPRSQPAPAPERASTGGATYGGTGSGVIGKRGPGQSGTSGFGAGAGGTSTGATGGHTGAPPAISIGAPTQTGSLDQAIIRRYVKRSMQKIQYCYEKELVSDPSLQGTATIHFTIDAQGNVTQSTGSGLPPVDACVAQVISWIAFTKPAGGGIVTVTYPFVFQPAAPDPAATP